jgi:hypothetical protein
MGDTLRRYDRCPGGGNKGGFRVNLRTAENAKGPLRSWGSDRHIVGRMSKQLRKDDEGKAKVSGPAARISLQELERE